MSEPVGSVPRSPGSRRVRNRRAADAGAAARATDAAPEPRRATPVAGVDIGPEDATPVINAQIMGQSADSAAPAKSAQKASSAYLEVEWSGGADRRNRRGKLAKTQV